MGQPRNASRLKRLRTAGKTNNIIKRRRKESLAEGFHPGAAVARYLFSPRHAFVFKTVLETGMPLSSAFMVARACRLSVDLVDFILADLVKAKLLSREDMLFRVTSSKRVDDWVQRFANPDLQTVIDEYKRWEKECNQ